MAMGFTQFQVDPSICGGFVVFLLVLTTAIIARVKGRRPPWRVFLVEVIAVAIIIVTYVAWDAPDAVYMNMLGRPIPSTVKILQARYEEHPLDPTALIHFSASPHDLQMLIHSNHLLFRTNSVSERSDGNSTPNWWKPGSLGTDAALFTRQVYSDGDTSFVTHVIGVWVNSATNEAYGFSW
jgi:hypothetical protein